MLPQLSGIFVVDPKPVRTGTNNIVGMFLHLVITEPIFEGLACVGMSISDVPFGSVRFLHLESCFFSFLRWSALDQKNFFEKYISLYRGTVHYMCTFTNSCPSPLLLLRSFEP